MLLKALDELEERTNLNNNFLVPATKGDLYKRKGELQRAQKAYEQALSLAVSPIDKKFLNRKILQCQEKGY